MSTSLFRSKQLKSKRSLKSLLITGPIGPQSKEYPTLSSQDTSRTYIDYNSDYAIVVLIAKYKFTSENPQELSIDAKEYLKLIDRLGNGWLKVAKLDNKNMIGLVPASYVDIAVNDPLKPISLKWLNEYKQGRITDLDVNEDTRDSSDNYSQNSFEGSSSTYSNNDPFDFEQANPKSVSVENVLKDSTGKFWYKLKFTMSNQDVIHVKKIYQHFYHLHAELLRNYPDCYLPKLPQPSRNSTTSTKLSRHDVQHLNNLKTELDIYISKLIDVPTIRFSNEMYGFIHEGFRMKDEEKDHNQLMSEIIDRLSPTSNGIHAFSTTAPLPLPESHRKSTVGKIQTRDENANYKYSTYIQQNKTVANSTSSNTLASYSSLIERYDDDLFQRIICKDEGETSFTESEDSSKDVSIDTHNTSLEDNSLYNRSSGSTQNSSNSDDEGYKSAKTEFIDTLKDLSPRGSSKFASGHSSSNSESDVDSVFSQKNSVPSTPNVATSGFFATDDCIINMCSPTTPVTPIMEHSELGDLPTSSLSKFSYRTNRRSRPASERLKNRISSLESIISDPSQQGQSETTTNLGNSKCNAGDYIKIKIFLNNREDDIVALKIKRNNLISVVYLKKLLSYKIYNDYNLINHYKLQAHDIADEMGDEELLQYIKTYSKISLNLVRVRGSI